MVEIQIESIKVLKTGVVVEYTRQNGEYKEKCVYPEPKSFLGEPTSEFADLIQENIETLIDYFYLDRSFWSAWGKVTKLAFKYRDDCLMVKISASASCEENKVNLTVSSPLLKLAKYDLNDLFSATKAYIDGERKNQQLELLSPIAA